MTISKSCFRMPFSLCIRGAHRTLIQNSRTPTKNRSAAEIHCCMTVASEMNKKSRGENARRSD